jgi:hypothetical protein
MTSHSGEVLAGHGPYLTQVEAIADLQETVQDRADGPLHPEHPPRAYSKRELPSVPAKSSTVLYETGIPKPGVPNTPAPTKSWQATLQGKGGFPADAQIAVSATHVVVTNRQLLRYYDKNGNPVANSIGSTAFFNAGLNIQDAAGNKIDRYNDLRVIFDSYRKRFWITAYAGFSGAANVAVAKRRVFIPLAVSKTQNPLDGWYYYYTDGAAQQGQAGSQIWQAGDAPDYPVMGVDKLALTITHAVNHVNGGGYWRVLLFQGDSLAGGQWLGGWQFWDLKNPDGSATGLIAPAVHHGSPNGGRAYWLGRQGSDSIVVWTITHTFDAQRHVQAVAVKMPSGFSSPVNGQQKGSTKLIKFTNLSNNVMKAAFRNEFLHMVTNDAHDWGSIGKVRSSIHYVRLPVSKWPDVPAPPGSGGIDRVFGGGNANEETGGLKHYGWAAVEANKNGDAIIGYARTGEQVFPEVRGSAFMANENDIRPSYQVKAGDTFADNPNYTNVNDVLPWGDTSGAAVDPSDDTSIWVAQEYASTTSGNNGNYDIWVAKFFGT